MLSATKNLFEKTIGFVAYISGPKERPTLSNPVLFDTLASEWASPHKSIFYVIYVEDFFSFIWRK